MSGNGGLNFFPLNTEVDKQPRYKSTAYAEGVLYDPVTNQGIEDATGIFTLWHEGVVVVNERTMTTTTDLGAGWLRCTITDLELANWGLYQWEMRLTNANGSLVLTDHGDFTV